jgi:hypothetical protein
MLNMPYVKQINVLNIFKTLSRAGTWTQICYSISTFLSLHQEGALPGSLIFMLGLIQFHTKMKLVWVYWWPLVQINLCAFNFERGDSYLHRKEVVFGYFRFSQWALITQFKCEREVERWNRRGRKSQDSELERLAGPTPSVLGIEASFPLRLAAELASMLPHLLDEGNSSSGLPPR